MKIKIDVCKLKIMINEFWSTDNNDTCAGATILFLEELGLSSNQIREMLPNYSKEDFRNKLNSTESYSESMRYANSDCWLEE